MTEADRARDLALTADHAHDAALDRDDVPAMRWPGKRTRTSSLDRSDLRIADLRRVRTAASAVRGSGPLPAELAADFGALLGVDLGDVRVHHGGAAGEQADELDAHAFTHGTQIALSGSLDPDSAFGRHVIAHEIVHVAQNKRGSSATGLAAHAVAGPSDAPHEQEAEAGAAALLAGQPFAVGAHGALPLVSRFQRGGGKRSPEPGPSPGPSGAPPGPGGAPPPGKSPPGVSKAPSDAPPSTRAPSRGPSTVPGRTPTPGAPAQKKDFDALVKEELEKRADPKLKAEYAKGVSQVDILRIQALQYTFQATGFWHMVVETFWPKTAIADHWNQIYSANAYRGGNSWIDRVQAVIEGARGVLHIIGDIAAAISAWAGLVSIIMGVIALLGSETVILGIGAGAFSAIAAQIAIIAAAVKLLADFIDTLLGVLQMAILIIRARNSKDPNERAKFAQLLHKEVNDFATNVVSIGVQAVVMVATAGVAAGFSKGFTKAALGASRGELAKLFGPVLQPHRIPEMLRSLGTPAVVGSKIKVPGKTLRGQPTERRPLLIEAEEGMLEILEKKRAVKMVMQNGRPVRKSVYTSDAHWVPFVSGKNTFSSSQMRTFKEGVQRAVKVDLVATTVGFKFGWLQAEAKGPREPTTPSGQSGGAERGRASSDLSTVDVWPSQIDAFERTKGPLGGAIGHSDRQYNRAASQAGGELAAKVGAAFGAAKDKAGKTRYLGLQVKGDATEGQSNAERGVATAVQGQQAQNQATDKKNEIDDSARKVGNEGQKLQAPKAKGGNIFDKIKEATIGKLGGLIGKAQKWVMNFVGKCVMKWAGFSKEELDLAGIENDMREDSKKDKTAEQQGGESALAADKVQQEVWKLQENKKKDEQYAIQGMVDAQRFVMALEEADQVLGDAIAGGQAYIDVITPLIRHELETKAEGKPIDASYLAPVRTFATAFLGSIHQFHQGSRARSDGLAELSAMKSKIPELDVGPGQSAIDKVGGQYDAAFAELAGAARDNTVLFQSVLSQFIGTTDYDGVHENAKGLDAIAAQFDRGAEQLADQLFTAVNAVLAAYTAHIKAAADEAARTPPDPAPGADPGGNAEDETDPGSERPGGR